jgi:hypothetical protein
MNTSSESPSGKSGERASPNDAVDDHDGTLTGARERERSADDPEDQPETGAV